MKYITSYKAKLYDRSIKNKSLKLKSYILTTSSGTQISKEERSSRKLKT